MTEGPMGPVRRGDTWLHHPELGHVVWDGERWQPFGDPPPEPPAPFWAKAVTAMFLTGVAVFGLFALMGAVVWMWRFAWRLAFG